ncbi:Meckel syndrome type 1 protein-like isoform X1 [Lytechinus variegatus]|uniref:Meckel syndrome type 1 protein-like isoform X1 n=1 Tax=Lytechinus variegatus TaxID=7654 RepID=UPI001BB208BF|nr:Meckel syndrome type 1 protein-like isoform X1 [Lytechinus variegatus]XP_041456600.1 Meckel syndrome type 1 protein-like isoform X1 [Lytechinus variegatus]XP_041456601.1 Meckel syndrome type 1 protein-like isoform X1 [Lytechinus variegatus]
MGDNSAGDFGSSYYRSLDPVKNLKIRVHLKRVTGASLVPKAIAPGGNKNEDGAEGQEGIPLKTLSKKTSAAGGEGSTSKEAEKPNTSNEEVYVFSWQEKVFSRREVQLYSNEASCECPLEQKYFSEIKEQKAKGGRITKRLFTYTDYDSFTHREEESLATTSPNEEASFLAEKMRNVRRRKKIERKKRDVQGDPMLMQRRTNLVVESPSEEQKKSSHVIDTPINTMYIMADLGIMDSEPREEDECTLCTIKVSMGGVITVSPDFTHHREPYTIVTDTGGRDTFQYSLTLASTAMSSKEQAKENKMYHELLQRHTDIITAYVGQDFEQVPPSTLRLCILGEIVSAKNFEYDGLYVHYFVELPRHWEADRAQMLSGVTQTCYTKEIDREYTSYFSHPFDMEVYYQMKDFTEEDQDTLPKWPQLFLEVLSLDSWQRYRTEGYGCITLPPNPGTYSFDVNMWRPLGRSSYDEMRRFFIGGSPELEDPSYVSVPLTHDGKVLSRFGLMTETTGSVTVKLNLMQQSRAFMDQTSKRKNVGTLIDKLGGMTMQASVASVMDLFQKARRRMQNAKDTLTKI